MVAGEKVKDVTSKAKGQVEAEKKVGMEPFSDLSDEKYVIAPLYRGLQVLSLLAERGEINVKNAYQALNVSRAQAFRYLQTLKVSGFADYDEETSLFRLGLRSWELGRAVSPYDGLLGLAQPFMENLRTRFNETVNLGVRDGGDVVYLGIVESTHSLRMHATVGAPDPLYSTSLGKAVLAFTPEETWAKLIPERLVAKTVRTITSHEALLENLRLTRERGYSLDDGENELGAYCVGAPIFDRYSGVVAALSVSAPETRLQGEFLEETIKAVVSTAAAISQRLKT